VKGVFLVRFSGDLSDEFASLIAEATYRAMIGAFIEYEQDVFSAAAAAGKAPWSK